MAININLAEVQKRDQRVGAIINFHGSASDLINKAESRTFKEPKRSFSQCSDCSKGCAETLTTLVRDAATIIHAPIGCLNPASYYNGGTTGASVRGVAPQKVQVLSTNITVKETVYGGAQKLRETTREAYRRFNPKAVFIHSSCAAGIIGDDIESVADELQDELGIPIIPVYCEGFKSKTWASGFDAAFHGILKRLVKPAENKNPNLVNVFNFQGVPSFDRILGALNLKANYIVPLSSVEDLQKLSSATCSTHICETLGTYVAEALEQKFGVPQVKAPSPYGLVWTDEWIRAVAKETGRSALAEKFIASEHERIKDKLEELRSQLKGVKIYVYAGDSYAHNMASLARDLGMEVVGITTLHHDQWTDNDSKELNTLDKLVQNGGDIKHFSVCNRQPYILFKLLQQIKPDILITRHNNIAPVGAKLGIPSLRTNDANVICFYDGLIVFGERILAALNSRKFYKNLAEHVKLPYTEWWRDEEDPFYFDE